MKPKRKPEWQTAPDMGLSHFPLSALEWSAVCGVTLWHPFGGPVADTDTEGKPKCPLCLEGLEEK